MDEREQTYINLKENLRKYGKSALVRGTGFGKSYMLVRLCGEGYKRILFLYPQAKLRNEMVKNYKEMNGTKGLENITFMSYMKLIH